MRRLTVLLRARAASSVVKQPHRAPQGRDQLQQRRQRPRASARQRKDAGDGVTRLCAARRAELVGRFRVFSFGGFLGIGEKLSFPWIALLQPCGSSRSRPARAQRRFVRQRGERSCWITRGPEGATGVQIYKELTARRPLVGSSGSLSGVPRVDRARCRQPSPAEKWVVCMRTNPFPKYSGGRANVGGPRQRAAQAPRVPSEQKRKHHREDVKGQGNAQHPTDDTDCLALPGFGRGLDLGFPVGHARH